MQEKTDRRQKMKDLINKRMEHLIYDIYSKNYNTMKAHYFFIQFAHTIRLLLEKGLKYIAEIKMSIKEVSAAITQTLTQNLTNLTEHKKIQNIKQFDL